MYEPLPRKSKLIPAHHQRPNERHSQRRLGTGRSPRRHRGEPLAVRVQFAATVGLANSAPRHRAILDKWVIARSLSLCSRVSDSMFYFPPCSAGL